MNDVIILAHAETFYCLLFLVLSFYVKSIKIEFVDNVNT